MYTHVHIYLIFSNDILELKWAMLLYTSYGATPMYTINAFFIDVPSS